MQMPLLIKYPKALEVSQENEDKVLQSNTRHARMADFPQHCPVPVPTTGNAAGKPKPTRGKKTNKSSGAVAESSSRAKPRSSKNTQSIRHAADLSRSEPISGPQVFIDKVSSVASS